MRKKYLLLTICERNILTNMMITQIYRKITMVIKNAKRCKSSYLKEFKQFLQFLVRLIEQTIIWSIELWAYRTDYSLGL